MPQTFEEKLRQAATTPAPTPTPTPARALPFEERLAQISQPTQQPPQVGAFERFRRNVGLAASQGYTAVKDKAAALAEIGGGIAIGDFRPAIEAGRSIGLGAQRFATSLFGQAALTSPEFGAPTPVAEVPAILERAQQQTAGGIAGVQAQRTARRQASGDTSFQQRAQRQAELEQEAQAFDSSLSGRLTRGVIREGIKLAPTVVAGALSGGSVPVIAATAGATSLDEPETVAANVALSSLPVPSVRAVRDTFGPAVSKLFGRGAAQLIEAEASGSGGALSQAIQQPLPGFEQAVKEAMGELPKPLARRVAENVAAAYHVPRAVMASADVSAPFRQGLIFTITNPKMAAKAGVEMFRGFRTKNFEQIARGIAQDSDAVVGQKFGLEFGSQIKDGLKKAEEAFISKWAGKIPIVKQSEQAYVTYLDVLRLQKFKQYKRIIDEAGLSRAETERAYSAASRWINYSTGRGDFGAAADKMMPLLNVFFFAPKFSMSRFNLLHPLYYAKNFTTAGGRVVLKQQAKELFQFASVVGSTLALAKAAGADVTLNPNSSDFGKITVGRYHYDIGAGISQAMKLVFRTSADLARLVRGGEAERGKTAVDVGARFLRSKLGPVPSWFVDAVTGHTYVGEKYSTGAAIRERALPLQWNSWIDAAWENGLGGALAVTPGAFGVGVGLYGDDSLLNRAAPLFSEYQKYKKQIPAIDKARGESDADYTARKQVFGESIEKFGMDLVNSDTYRNSPPAVQQRALEILPRKISGALMTQGQAWELRADILVDSARESLQLREERQREQQQPWWKTQRR